MLEDISIMWRRLRFMNFDSWDVCLIHICFAFLRVRWIIHIEYYIIVQNFWTLKKHDFYEIPLNTITVVLYKAHVHVYKMNRDRTCMCIVSNPNQELRIFHLISTHFRWSGEKKLVFSNFKKSCLRVVDEENSWLKKNCRVCY